jgi:hypothetical protein
MRGSASKFLTQALLSPLIFIGSPLAAQQATNKVQAPEGMISCPPNDPVASGLARMVGAIGTVGGCFISPERVQIQGSAKAISRPLQFAFAITIPSNPSNPFRTANVDAMYAKTQAQWDQVAPMWRQSESTYEQSVKALIEKSKPSGAPQFNMTISQPIFVTMQRVNPSAYVVVSVRQRQMTIAGNTISPIAANGFALILSQGNLVRLTLERQMRSSADVDAVKSEILTWVQAVQGTGK